MRASTGRSRSRSAQKPWMVLTCASSKRCTARSEPSGLVAGGGRAGPARVLRAAQLQLAGGLLREGHRHDLVDGRPAARDQPHDPLHELGGLAGAGGGLDDERVRSSASAMSRRSSQVGAAGRSRHPPQRVEVGNGRLAAGCALVRRDRTPAGSRRYAQAGCGPSVPGLAARVPCSTARSMISSTSRPRWRMRSSSAIGRSVKPPGGGAVRQAPFGHGLAGQGLERHGVEHRLQHASAVDDGGRRRAVLAGLVVGDPQMRAVEAPLHQVDRAAQQVAGRADAHRLAHRRGVASGRRAAARTPSSKRSGSQCGASVRSC